MVEGRLTEAFHHVQENGHKLIAAIIESLRALRKSLSHISDDDEDHEDDDDPGTGIEEIGSDKEVEDDASDGLDDQDDGDVAIEEI